MNTDEFIQKRRRKEERKGIVHSNPNNCWSIRLEKRRYKSKPFWKRCWLTMTGQKPSF